MEIMIGKRKGNLKRMSKVAEQEQPFPLQPFLLFLSHPCKQRNFPGLSLLVKGQKREAVRI